MTRNKERGFSLLEVLVAMLILTLVITTTLAVFLERNRRIQQANETIVAYQVLANEAEVQRRIAFNELEDGPFLSTTELLQPLAPFTTSVEVRPRRPNVKNVTLTITWRGGAKSAVLKLARVNTGGDNLW